VHVTVRICIEGFTSSCAHILHLSACTEFAVLEQRCLIEGTMEGTPGAAASGKPGSPRGCLKTSSTPPKHRASKSLRFGADQFAPEQVEDDADEPEPTAPSSPAAAAASIAITVPDSPSAAAAAPASPAAAGSVAARAAMFQQRAAASAASGSPPLSPAKSPGGHARSKTGVGAVYSPASSPSAAKVAGAKSPVRFAVPGAASPPAPAAAASPTAAATASATAAVVPPSPPSPHRRTQTVSVLERAKLFAAKPDTDSDEEVETPTAAQKRLSLAALTKEGTVSGLRNMLAEVGFDPAAAPSAVKDMIARGGKGQIKQQHSSDSDGSDGSGSSSEQDEDENSSNASSSGSGSGGDSDSDSGEVVRGSAAAAAAAAPSGKAKAAGSTGGASPTVKPAGRGHGRSKTGITREGSRGFGESSGGGFCAPPALNTSSKVKAKKQPTGQYVYRSGCEGAVVKLQTLARVLTARSAVRRKLVSEVTAFSMIMERGIQMTKHPFGSRARPKKVVLSIVQRRGVMQVHTAICLLA
jgi:hypothetical protein